MTEYCSGGELFDRIIKQGRISEGDVIRYMTKMMRAVNHLHQIKVCHRDIKPQNFVFENSSSDAELKLIDFGISHINLSTKKKNQTHIMETFAGTSFYSVFLGLKTTTASP